MNKRNVNGVIKVLLVAMLLGVLSPAIARAQSDDERIKNLEAAVKTLQDELKAEKAGIDWIQRITPFGDFRYRHETFTDKDSDDEELGNERRRNRIRARLGFKAEISEEWDTIFRIATGSSDTPTSTNQTLDDSFSSKELWLDLGYAAWHPQSKPGLDVFMGKMKNPFYRVGKNELVWDSDVNPEGGAATYNWDLDDSTTATVAGGGFWLNEREAGGDAGYFGIQGLLKRTYENDRHLVAGASYYDIGNIDGFSSTGSGVTLMGNTPAAPGGTTYKYDFNIAEFFGEYGFECHGRPLALFGSYVENTAAKGGDNTGYILGVQLNKAKKPGSWQAKLSYREVQSDAVFGGLTDSDFISGGTGGRGWELGLKYQLQKNMQAGLAYFINERDRRVSGGSGGSGSQNFDGLQVDFVIKF